LGEKGKAWSKPEGQYFEEKKRLRETNTGADIRRGKMKSPERTRHCGEPYAELVGNVGIAKAIKKEKVQNFAAKQKGGWSPKRHFELRSTKNKKGTALRSAPER